ncbi:unnamed protein product [Miscanthus lutarioriparius]|uniref:RNase H type-1 domain-containing protein n=1 Tax=Miscanthus lutarioriparius TaxID=422564 RepID=A0A811PQH8_9POAL|nr:unnamed protein product [Miscanthus lutarioriparius]
MDFTLRLLPYCSKDHLKLLQSIERVLHEAKAIDGAYNIAFQDDTMSQLLPHPTTTPTVAQASQFATLQVLEPLEAEAHALLFGAKLAAALDLRNAALLTGNQVVASAVLAGSPRTHHGHWSLRPIIAETQDIKQAKSYSVIKIDRQKNKIADVLAKRARRASLVLVPPPLLDPTYPNPKAWC